MLGSEYGARQIWTGTQEKLQGQVDEIVQTILSLVPLQIEMRKEREAAALMAQQQAEARERERRRAEARSEQLKQAFEMATADANVGRLEAFLEQLEASAETFNAPYNERVEVWIRVVRAELAMQHPVNHLLQRCLSEPHRGGWPPQWWPADVAQATNGSRTQGAED